MKQKLMIACGFIHEPDVLIFDEPLTGLDPLGIRRMKESIVRRSQAGASVILSSHLLHLVEELCDTVAVIQNGTRIAYDTIDNLKWKITSGRNDLSLEEAFLQDHRRGDAGGVIGTFLTVAFLTLKNRIAAARCGGCASRATSSAPSPARRTSGSSFFRRTMAAGSAATASC